MSADQPRDAAIARIGTIRIVDLAAKARAVYGDQADYVAGRTLPEHDYRFEVVEANGTRISFAEAATAAYVIRFIEERSA
jgi:hypothetical protein